MIDNSLQWGATVVAAAVLAKEMITNIAKEKTEHCWLESRDVRDCSPEPARGGMKT